MNRTARILSNIALVICCVLAGVSVALSQGTDLGTIRGTVTDPNGAAVVNATVRVTDVATNTSRDLTTNGEGNYEAANLKSGTYVVTVNQQGFNTTEILRNAESARVRRALLLQLATPDPRVLLAFGAVILLLRKMRALHESSGVPAPHPVKV